MKVSGKLKIHSLFLLPVILCCFLQLSANIYKLLWLGELNFLKILVNSAIFVSYAVIMYQCFNYRFSQLSFNPWFLNCVLFISILISFLDICYCVSVGGMQNMTGLSIIYLATYLLTPIPLFIIRYLVYKDNK